MEDNPAPRARCLMDINTYKENFCDKQRKTYLCYEVEVREGDDWTPMLEHRGFLRNQVNLHAELCFLDLFRSWLRDQGRQYRLTWYLSWSPCPDCARELVEFLRENSHLSLRIFYAHIYTFVSGYGRGLRELRDAGAKLAIMTGEEHQHCWATFVDNQGQRFEP